MLVVCWFHEKLYANVPKEQQGGREKRGRERRDLSVCRKMDIIRHHHIKQNKSLRAKYIMFLSGTNSSSSIHEHKIIYMYM